MAEIEIKANNAIFDTPDPPASQSNEQQANTSLAASNEPSAPPKTRRSQRTAFRTPRHGASSSPPLSLGSSYVSALHTISNINKWTIMSLTQALSWRMNKAELYEIYCSESAFPAKATSSLSRARKSPYSRPAPNATPAETHLRSSDCRSRHSAGLPTRWCQHCSNPMVRSSFSPSLSQLQQTPISKPGSPSGVRASISLCCSHCRHSLRPSFFIQHCRNSVAPVGAFSILHTATIVPLPGEPSIFLHHCWSSTRSNVAQFSPPRPPQLPIPMLWQATYFTHHYRSRATPAWAFLSISHCSCSTCSQGAQPSPQRAEQHLSHSLPQRPIHTQHYRSSHSRRRPFQTLNGCSSASLMPHRLARGINLKPAFFEDSVALAAVPHQLYVFGEGPESGHTPASEPSHQSLLYVSQTREIMFY